MYIADETESYNPFEIGAGYINLARAMVFTGPYPGVHFDSVSPVVIPTAKGLRFAHVLPLTRVASVLWGDTALWTDGILWGDTALWTDRILWGDTALWTDSVLGEGD